MQTTADPNLLLKQIQNKCSVRKDVLLEMPANLTYTHGSEQRTYQFTKLISKNIAEKAKLLLIRAGIHGDEIAGPRTLADHLDEIFDYAHCKNLGLVMFPLDNPSGFEMQSRYNIEGDSGQAGNNDFIRYELADGTFVDDLENGRGFVRWLWASDLKFQNAFKLPQETLTLHRELLKLPLDKIVAAIDIHQDSFIEAAGTYFYHFSSTPSVTYSSILAKISAVAPILKNLMIGSGQRSSCRSDDFGGIVRHDGSLSDLMHRIGANHSITVETTTALEARKSDAVNLIWIKGVIDLVAG